MNLLKTTFAATAAMTLLAAADARAEWPEKSIEFIHHQMVTEFIDKAKEFDLSSIELDVDEVAIRTAFNLKEDIIEKLKAILVSKYNRPIDVKEVVDNELIAGLILHIGSLRLDGALSDALKDIAIKAKEEVQ